MTLLNVFNDVTSSIITFTQTHQNWVIPIVFLMSFGESLAFLSLLMPATVILFAIGALISESEMLFLPIWLAATLGAFFGDWVSYWFGFHYNEKIHHMWPFNKKPMMLHRGFFFFQKYGVMSVFAGRFFGPFRAVVPLIAGICQMDKRHFMIANITSALLWAFGILAPGAFGLPWLIELLN